MTMTLLNYPNHKPLRWSGNRTREGHREYKVSWLAKSDSIKDGPASAMTSIGLPTVGSIWNLDGDIDAWAYCLPTMTVTPHKTKEGDPTKYWKVEQSFSTLPLSRCQDASIEDPLLEPQKISGSFNLETIKTSFDATGQLVLSSSLEPYDFEKTNPHPTVVIEQNVASLGLSTFAQMVNTVNVAPLWGLPARTIKLVNVSWSRKIQNSCAYYYTRAFEFEVDYTTFDEIIRDQGQLALGSWDGENWVVPAGADKTNPQHFNRYKDSNGENVPTVFLDGDGNPVTDLEDCPSTTVQLYTASNFLTLGIPTSF